MVKKIIILGAGFGGLRTALGLAKKFSDHQQYEIILIDKNSYHTYTPSLYEVATAYRGRALKNVSAEVEFEEELAGSSCFVISEIIAAKNIHFLHDEVTDIHLAEKRVVMKNVGEVDFDYLVVALGSEATYFGVQGAQQCCSTLKTLTDALNIRDEIEAVLAQKRRKTTRLVTVGGGLSGVEVAAEMAKYAKHLAKNYAIDGQNINIEIIEAGPSILSSTPNIMQKHMERRLNKLGVGILTNRRVQKIEPRKLYFEDGSVLEADFIFWAGGIRGPKWLGNIEGMALDEKSGRILIDRFLRVRGYDTVFAIGDAALFLDEERGAPVPATAWAAEQQADAVIYNISAALRGGKLRAYRAKFPGFVSAAGGKYAVAHLFGFTFAGPHAWLIKRVIDFKYIWSLYPKWKGFKIWCGELRLFVGND